MSDEILIFNRTLDQLRAKDLDRALFRLKQQAQRNEWPDIVDAIQALRRLLTVKMHEDDQSGSWP